MMPKSYYIAVFIMLIAIIFLLIYIASGVSKIKNKHKSLSAYIDTNHSRFIRIFDETLETSRNVDKLAELKDSLDAKRNFIEGLDHGKEENE